MKTLCTKLIFQIWLMSNSLFFILCTLRFKKNAISFYTYVMPVKQPSPAIDKISDSGVLAYYGVF